ncbi:winged helix-turn-helix transcriptional regulator [Chitinophaga polysaccharea]|uniref:ArsR/SmtB family transcription factor n=1 Tax=Chitinophaga TaxID=79328 RepID=UPI001455778A|nr:MULTISPECIES: metalloregulator ArsR/SmtB family transcription factor [Chitinophaga]NLR57785.1 winged helix-turn-helix transcriptional regulator [Chitinophaga polysaccharea]NLU93379.1 winged helix-turn-helix transcriptional regulator [Chitinophaga sp. Ak27]
MRRDVFQAIADPTRRAILLLIATKPMTPGAIAEHFEISRQAVSRHLRILTACQLLQQTQTGREIYYRLDGTKLAAIAEWLEKCQAIWEKKFDTLDIVLSTIKTQKK